VDPINAIFFYGSNFYVNVPDDTTLDLTTDGTLEAWIYAASALQNGGIVSKGDTTDGYHLSMDSSGNIYFSL
jgi:hypothetical protein